ncbi:MarR family winged helix-turn-helix transcriptional regulator [Hymenobacter tibetensis]|uniref:MarR family winged helix-turn-helix transcriptional regulator n=1 Tax=Hymenobacter tibetensis TaxID=497967 RepID=A0ABY4D3N3_9BACT|nr:MarR family winged helix-turn-helix transcriptional regulator [Hymenobacter tibetensis]UOG76647.1 MarR family winged helix-turn-helix transcriptional regulator [Hymenobacter tibetensis]
MLSSIIFYSLDKAIRQYRKLAQANIDRAGIAITIDQWLVLRVIQEHDDLTQTDIAERVFKDQASVARMISLLLKAGLLAAEPLPHDGRRSRLRVSEAGLRTLDAVQPVVLNNRQLALEGLTEEDLAVLRPMLERIYNNCLVASQPTSAATPAAPLELPQ